jgi:hypothetical protein
MIKVEIHNLGSSVDIEIKKNENQYFLLVITSKSDYFKQNGSAWNGMTENEEQVREVANSIMQCYSKPSAPKSISINDGKIIKVKLKEKEEEVSLIIKDISEGTIEFQLMQKLFEFIHTLVQDSDLEQYIKRFGY